MKPTLFFFLVLLSAQVNAQSPFTRILYQDTAYTSGNFYGLCTPIQTTADGGHLLQFYTGQYVVDGGGYDQILLVKTDSNFYPLWQKMRGNVAIILKDSSIFTCAWGGFYDTACMVFEKMDLGGHVLWSKIFCKDDSSMLQAFNPVYANSKIRFMGSCQFNSSLPSYVPIFVDIDSMGNLVSADSIAGDTTSFEHLFADDSGNYYFVLTGLYGGGNRSVTKLRSDNSIVWSYTLKEYGYDIASMITLSNGDVILGGNYQRTDTVRIFLMKLSATGNLIWQKTANRPCRLTDMELTKTGDIIIAGGGVPVNGFNYLSEDNIIEIDTAAHIKWARNIAPDRTIWPFYLGLSTPYIGNNNSLYFAAGTQNPYAAMVFSTDSMGIGHCNSAAVTFSFYDTSLFTLLPGTINFAPITVTISNHPVIDTVLPQLYVDSCDYAVPNYITNTTFPKNFEIYPNPASNNFHISNTADIDQIDLFDLTGKPVSKIQGEACRHNIDIQYLKNGYYMIRITSKYNGYFYKKLIIIN